MFLGRLVATVYQVSTKSILVKYMPLIFVGLAGTITPTFTVFMSYCMIGEKIEAINFFMLAIITVGVIFITIGEKKHCHKEDTNQQKSVEEKMRLARPIWAYMILFSKPFVDSLNKVLMRKSKKMDENTVNLYTNPMMMLIFGIYMY